MVLDSFIKRSVTGGLGSSQAEIMADTAVALASANDALVARKVIVRLCTVRSLGGGGKEVAVRCVRTFLGGQGGTFAFLRFVKIHFGASIKCFFSSFFFCEFLGIANKKWNL